MICNYEKTNFDDFIEFIAIPQLKRMISYESSVS